MQKMEKKSDLKAAILSIKQHFLLTGLFSAAINMLMLTPVIYMLTVYDRVVSSGSLSTLGMLTLLMLALLISAGGFEWVRSMILINATSRLETLLRSRVSDATFKGQLYGLNIGSQPLADLIGLRQFLTGNGTFAFFDAPWFPVYIAVMFMFHPWFGVAGIVAGVAMVCLAIANEASTNKLMLQSNADSNRAIKQYESRLRNAEAVAAMGMSEELKCAQDGLFDSVINKQALASQRASVFSAVTKYFRIITQSLLLGLGAFLALNQQISPGMMIAGSLLLGRALAPVDLLVGTWKQFSVARAQYTRLEELLEKIPQDSEKMVLPAPSGHLNVEGISVVPPGSKSIVLRGISFQLQPGQVLGVVGASASGKSTLMRALLGIWPTSAGKVRLDGADISSWSREEIGPHIGYLPQDIELFDGTIAENICRFKQVDPDTIVAAAKLADVHEMILRLPQGYDTPISGTTGILSGGQRQRIGLARAVFGSPSFIVLDEPNSNLDEAGEKSLVNALLQIKKSGSTIILVTHRPYVLKVTDLILLLKEGSVVGFGPKEEVFSGKFDQKQAS